MWDWLVARVIDSNCDMYFLIDSGYVQAKITDLISALWLAEDCILIFSSKHVT